MKRHCENADSRRISEGKKRKCRRHTRTHSSRWYVSGVYGQFVCLTAGKTVMNDSEKEATFELPAHDMRERSADVVRVRGQL